MTLKTDKRNKKLPSNAYNYEAIKIELFAGTFGKPDGDATSTNNSISAAKLLNGVEKSYEKDKKLLEDYSVTLDANGEPMVQCIPATLG